MGNVAAIGLSSRYEYKISQFYEISYQVLLIYPKCQEFHYLSFTKNHFFSTGAIISAFHFSVYAEGKITA